MYTCGRIFGYKIKVIHFKLAHSSDSLFILINWFKLRELFLHNKFNDGVRNTNPFMAQQINTYSFAETPHKYLGKCIMNKE